jgi:hypothetical protein
MFLLALKTNSKIDKNVVFLGEYVVISILN